MEIEQDANRLLQGGQLSPIAGSSVPQQNADRGRACVQEDRTMPILGCLAPLQVLTEIKSDLNKCHQRELAVQLSLRLLFLWWG